MATILLGLAGASIGGGLFGPGLGVIAGRAIGAFAGSLIDRAIVSALTPPVERTGPRLTTTDIQDATEGAPIDRLHGRARLTGHMIWATRFEEQVTTETSGGKGFGGPKVTTTTYAYFGNFAVALCEGPVAGIGRIWADGKEIDQTEIEFRFHPGSETQTPDPLIEAKEGQAPPYRGVAYLVFERLALAKYGNRFPQISVEVFRPPGDLETALPGVAVIGGNEFGFDTEKVTAATGNAFAGVSEQTAINRHQTIAATDWEASIDRLQMLCPNVESVMLVAPWFGDDLRCGQCTIRPKVDDGTKATSPHLWTVSGLDRATALVISKVDGKPAYGGSANDASLIRAIQNLKARGLKVTLLPFLMMDIAAGNALADPWSDNAASVGQPLYPWRGRITGSPAAGFAGTVDKTATAAAQVAAFLGTALPGHFSGAGTTITYSGPAEWSYRRFILHHARLAQLAGGVDTFLIGSEMVGLTQLRSDASTYPFVAGLVSLLTDCRSILGPAVAIGYSADWSEYHSHRPADGSGDVFFNLDPVWAHADCDFIGIDNYLPLSDWRDGSGHLDLNGPGRSSIHDQAYLRGNIEGGEYYDWYYASQAARDVQDRTPISDGLSAKHWVFRQKDIRNWWLNAHHDRPGGVEAGAPTAWTAQAKPVRFIEFGCPAVDKGANQPNVFVDPKSSESFYPHYSNGARDDAMQRAWLEAMIGYWSDAANNPVSSVYAGPMIDLHDSHAWSWDARLWPDFPLTGDWGDAPNWETGHWLGGRVGTAPALETIRAILADASFADYLIEAAPFAADGVTAGTLTSPRAMLEALRPIFQFDAVESDGVIKFLSRHGHAPALAITENDLVADPEDPVRYRLTRAQESELPDAVKIRYGDPGRDDQPASTEARRSAGGGRRISEFSPPVLLAENLATAAAERELHAAWTGREQAAFSLPPRYLALDPGDVIDFTPAGMKLKLGDIGDAGARQVEAFRVDTLARGSAALPKAPSPPTGVATTRPASVVFVDGPLLSDDDSSHAGYAAGIMKPFGGGIALWRSAVDSGFTFDTLLPAPAILGETTADFYSGPAWRWDRVNTLHVRLARGALSSAAEELVLNGANALLVENPDGEWELFQFLTATATGPFAWALSGLLRGQKGSEHAMRAPVPSGARVVVINAAIRQTALPSDLIGLPLNWRSGPANLDIAADGFTEQSVTLSAKGLRPLAPAHLRAVTDLAGDTAISWIRRTRISGDSWDQPDVPLGEETEAYEVDILDGLGAPVRTIATSSPTVVYTAAQRAADAIAAPFDIAVYQLSASYGRGIAKRITVHV